jgi:adenosine deaminase
MERVARDGIVLEICPTSNLRTKAVRDVAELRFILDTLRAHGVPFTINTDGPEMLLTNVVQEYLFLLDEGIFTEDDVRRTIETAHTASFLNRAYVTV